MKKIISFLLVAALTLCLFAMPATAEEVFTGYGDTDQNKKIEAADALSILKYVVGKEDIPLAQNCFWDVNGDYAVNASDALDVLKRVVGKISVFDAEAGYQPFSIQGYTALNMYENTSYDLNFVIKYATDGFKVGWEVAPEHEGVLNCTWSDWNGDNITLTVNASQVSKTTVIPLYVYIVQQPSSYFVCNVTIYNQ